MSLLVAAPAEAAAVAAAWPGMPPPHEDWLPAKLDERFELVRTGVGKVNAAVAAARIGVGAGRVPGVVINLGICGALPAEGGVVIGDVVIASSSTYADEGVVTPEGFLDLTAIGFPVGAGAFPGSGVEGDGGSIELARSVLVGSRVGVVATVSTCSGTDEAARAVAARTGALAEAMEGAAIGHALARLHGGRVRFVEIRVVSNTTGDRGEQRWEMRRALGRLTEVATALRGM